MKSSTSLHNRLIRHLREWHRKLGIIAAFFIIFLSITGVALNHTTTLSLAHEPISNTWLLDHYGIAPPHDIRFYQHSSLQVTNNLVWLDGSTETDNQGGSISCAIGPGGGGCFGFAQWEKSSVYEAIVWDLKDFSEKGRLRVDSAGTSYLIGAVAPIPLLTPVKKDACSSLGKQLKKFFTVQDQME